MAESEAFVIIPPVKVFVNSPIKTNLGGAAGKITYKK